MTERAPDCDGCKIASKLEGHESPCDTCKPIIMPANQDALRIYALVSNQVIIGGMGDIIGLNYNAVKFIMDLYGIENQRDCFERVVHIFNKILAARKNNAE
ncbi:MAG: DUF1799 domain-containing protein [Candidatus Omnitrophica bacterium]|nr:DUF1799 domain-containing protein [Candidatus Omnitrophota bacterium]